MIPEKSIGKAQLDELTKQQTTRMRHYANYVTEMLGIIFSRHGTDDAILVSMVDWYEDLNAHLIYINELLEKQDHDIVPQDTIRDFRKVILKGFGGKARFIKECFLSFKNFEANDILKYLPIVERI